ncbi:PP2C family protein-serine/threonine phosphatase [Streptomyces odontomachi]|uniref:PP2C family protein-serine/threonine phosphatase n=1 Tax=Streptomyces odontomachi TaxID=2944940 RepID=UPI0035A89537
MPQPQQAPQMPQQPHTAQQAEQPQPSGQSPEPLQPPQPPAFQAPVAPEASAISAHVGSPESPESPESESNSDYRLAAPQPPAGQPMRDDTPPGQPSHQPHGTTDPRTVEPGALPAPAAEAKLCVFCGTGRVERDDYCGHCGKAQPRERDHMEQELDAVAAVSDRGLRHHRNEDAFAITSTALQDGAPAVVAVVCDGVSSASRPDDASMAASRAATETLLNALPRGTHPQQALHEAILAAAEAVNALAHEPATAQESGQHENAPACTLVSAIVAKDLLIVGWVGDSRAYWVPVDRAAPPARLTEDDSWAAQMVASGLMNEAEAYADERAHAITGWLGADAYELLPHTAAFKPDRPGVVVVCTDGLWNYAESAADMAAVLPADAAQRPLNSAQVLVGHALEGGGHDNVTVAVLPFPAPPVGAGSA